MVKKAGCPVGYNSRTEHVRPLQIASAMLPAADSAKVAFPEASDHGSPGLGVSGFNRGRAPLAGILGQIFARALKTAVFSVALAANSYSAASSDDLSDLSHFRHGNPFPHTSAFSLSAFAP